MEKKKLVRIRVGDIIEIPLPGNKKAFAHYLHKDSWGNIIGVFDYIVPSEKNISVESLQGKQFLFPPIIARINSGMDLSEIANNLEEFNKKGVALSPSLLSLFKEVGRDFNWKKIGTLPVVNFTYPNYIWKKGGREKINYITHWYLYDGNNDTEIGTRLLNEYKKLEYMASYSADAVVERIMTRMSIYEEIIWRG